MIQTTTILSCSSCDAEIRGAYLRVIDDAQRRGWDLRYDGRERCEACVKMDAAEARPVAAEACTNTLCDDPRAKAARRNHVLSDEEMEEHAANFMLEEHSEQTAKAFADSANAPSMTATYWLIMGETAPMSPHQTCLYLHCAAPECDSRVHGTEDIWTHESREGTVLQFADDLFAELEAAAKAAGWKVGNDRRWYCQDCWYV